MADRRHRALAAIASIRAAERAEARQQLFLATLREREAEAALERADARTADAVEAWQGQLGGGFNPELASALAGRLIEHAQAGHAARDHVRASAEESERCGTGWRTADARQRLADDMLDDSRRDIARRRSDAALEAAEDRVTYAWSRRP